VGENPWEFESPHRHHYLYPNNSLVFSVLII
jgi:hypothetical protein